VAARAIAIAIAPERGIVRSVTREASRLRYHADVGHAPDEEGLEALGIHIVTDEDSPAVRAACLRVAQRLQHAERRIIGLLPSSPDIGVPAIGVQLGLALAEVSSGTVAFVDANLRWPAISQLAQDEPRRDEGAFATRWIRGSLALLTPPRAGQAGAGVPQLAHIIREGGQLFGHVLVDLSGFKRLGEHLAAIEMTDGVVIVSRAGRTREDELLRLQHELPASRNLGVLLLGAMR
jgi:Mrp family chromosome partitioning ATPase